MNKRIITTLVRGLRGENIEKALREIFKDK